MEMVGVTPMPVPALGRQRQKTLGAHWSSLTSELQAKEEACLKGDIISKDDTRVTLRPVRVTDHLELPAHRSRCNVYA